jgi:hypothetical protein
MPALRFHLLVDWLFALGVLLALETQLRSETSIAGPGEILLAAWIGLLLLHEQFQPSMCVSRVTLEISAFWSIFAFALCVGAIQSIVSATPVDIPLGLHDVIADSLVAAICVVLTLGPDAALRVRRTLWNITVLGGVLLALQLANASFLFRFSDIDPWYWDRMRGWTNNPNQFALLCLLIAFVALHVAETETGLRRAVGVFCCALAIIGGLFAKSNAYLIFVVGGLVFFLAAKALRWVLRLERRRIPALSFCAAAAALVAGLVLLSTPLIEKGDLMRSAGGVARDNRTELEDSSTRTELWLQALQRGADSWLAGLGPGPHLDIPSVVLAGRRGGKEPANMQHPFLGLAPNFEAHNTVLEVFLQGGLIAVCAFLWIVGLALYRSWRAGMDGMVAALLAVNTFGSFHVVFRHPFFWFVICGALIVTGSPAPRIARRQMTKSLSFARLPMRFQP